MKDLSTEVGAAMAAALGVVIEMNDSLSSTDPAAGEKVVLLPAPRYPSMPRFPPSPGRGSIDASEILKATFKVCRQNLSPFFSNSLSSF